MNEKTKKIIVVVTMFTLIVTLLVLSIIFVAKGLDKPSKKASEKIVEKYLEAINKNDGSIAISVIDAEGYLIYSQEGVSEFDKVYKNRKEYLEEFYEDNEYDGLEDYKDFLSDDFENKHRYNSYHYTLGKIISVEKSKESKKISGKIK